MNLMLGLDACLIPLAFIAAYYLRFHVHLVLSAFPLPQPVVPSALPYYRIAAFAGMVWVFLLAKEKIYSDYFHYSRPLAKHVKHVIVAGLYSLSLLMIISFMVRYFLLSRLVYLFGFVIACSLLVCVRAGFDLLGRRLDRQCVVLNRVLLFGSQPGADEVIRRLFRENGCTRLVGRVVWDGDSNKADGILSDIATVGTVQDIPQIHASNPINHLVVLDSGLDYCCGCSDYRLKLMEAINFCEEEGISVYIVSGLIDMTVSRQEVGSVDGVALVRLRDSSLHPCYGVLKRAMDVFLSLAVMITGLPLWLIIALLIKLTSKGPVFYTQERVGLHGSVFPMYKFRSMEKDADKKLADLVDFHALEEPVFNIRQDPRVTEIGRLLRRTSIDEVPQFINVLAGSMSIIGPRPERIELVEKYNAFQRRRLKAKPGITGYQQVISRGDPSLAKRIEYDLFYLKNQSFSLDLYILFKTVIVVIRGDGVL